MLDELYELAQTFKTISNDEEHKGFLIKKTNFLTKLNETLDEKIFNTETFINMFFENDEHDYVYLLSSSDNNEECYFYDAIYYFEDKKNNYRCKDKEFFEYYDKLQELFYTKMELIYPNEKDEAIPDKWDTPIICVSHL
jgi:hypothetical protein